VLCAQPFVNCFYRDARYELLYTIWQILIAPFGHVRFRDFFFADILTSMTGPLVDIGMTFSYLTQGNFLERNPNIEKTGALNTWIAIMAFAPYWWRFWQCINKWHNSGNKMQLVNSMKYFSKFLPPLAYYCGASKLVSVSSSYWWYFSAQLLQASFSLYWDFRWDWGLFIGTT
jgi:hypothetical protein